MSRYPLLPSNYCRNPDGEPSIWCYTTDPNKRWDYCDPICTPTTSAPPPTTTAACTKDEACTDSKCQDYKGKQTKTRSGKTCQKWSSMTPHMSRYPLLPSNYCRNPDGEPSIWCYTTDPNKRWDYC